MQVQRLRLRFAVIREYQNFSSKLFYFYEGFVNSGRISYSGAFMLSTMEMCLSLRPISRLTIRLNSMVNASE